MEDLNFIGNDPGAVRYGNFINYYKFHPVEARIDSLPKDIWNNDNSPKDDCVALDIGCNCGDLTVALHRFLGERAIWKNVKMLGIDIDSCLISRANLIKNDDISFECADICTKMSDEMLNKYLHSVTRQKFDVVFSFSITMWIHLNTGDDGLISFLNSMCKLADFLVIEPQPWKCYRTAVRRMKKSGESFPMYSQLKIKSNIEDEIKKCILENGFLCVYETASTEWQRKILFFRRK